MKAWALALFVQLLILALGFGLKGPAFTAVSVLNAPVVNLILWTCLITLAGLAISAATRPVHRWLTAVLLVAAVCWFPISLLVFGNARFSGTSDFLWQAWLIGTGLLLVGSLLSLSASAIAAMAKAHSRK
ncbi:hypothetical protein [Wenzhouxiangella sp. EGI_FJ10409]|uniref:hypothetical protein n=1 Tax=Wenzhouxiangella sp. EGI_FJ10409 TaxID=3243767 RepID=UPI0035D87DF8